MKRSLMCRCGHCIFQRDVMRQGYYVRQFGPSFVYIRYRCSRCKRLGEHFVPQEEWEDSMLSPRVEEFTDTEKNRFTGLGTITLDEMRDFHSTLQELNSIPDPLKEE